MSDNIPFDIQREIIKRVSSVKSLIQFRSVSKPWKSFIDSSDFIKGYGARHTQPHSHILSLSPGYKDELRYIRLVDDDVETLKVQQQEFAPFVMSPLIKNYFPNPFVVGACHGLLCLCGFHRGYNKLLFVIWNPSIGKSFGIDPPKIQLSIWTDYGFGVCPVTRDPTVVKITRGHNMPGQVEVFTLSSGVWNVIPCGNLPRCSIRLDPLTQVIDRFIYWGAQELTFDDDGESTTNHMVVSFDLITKEFKVVDLPDSLANEVIEHLSLSKLRESLVVYGDIKVEEALCCGVWVMEPDSSFRKLFSIGAPITKILGFTKSGEPICESVGEYRQITTDDVCGHESFKWFNTLDVYEPHSRHIKNLGISGVGGTFFIDCYKESLLLLDHSDLQIY